MKQCHDLSFCGVQPVPPRPGKSPRTLEVVERRGLDGPRRLTDPRGSHASAQAGNTLAREAHYRRNLSQRRNRANRRKRFRATVSRLYSVAKQCSEQVTQSQNHCLTTECSRETVPRPFLLWRSHQCHPAVSTATRSPFTVWRRCLNLCHTVKPLLND